MIIEAYKINECYVKIYSEQSIEREICSFFTFKVPGYQFMEKFKNHTWDGNISLYNLKTKLLPIGLYPRLVEYCKDNNIEVVFKETERYSEIDDKDDVSLEEVKEFVDSLDLWSKTGPLVIRDYQLDGIHVAVRDKKRVMTSPTASGKSCLIYCIVRWILEIDPDARVLLIVPNVGLVNQMFGDFAEYSSHNGFDVNKNIQKLYSGQVKELTKRVLITTWQSFSKVAADKVNGPKILSLYRGVIYDECHGAKGTESQKILEKCTSASYRIGTTGTIPTGNDVKVHALVIEGFLGPSYKVITTKELMDNQQVSNLNIKILALKYSPDTCFLMKKAEYPDEIKWLVANESRNNLLVKIALNANGTTLLLVRNRETHAKVLFDILKAKANIPVYYLTGSVDADERERIRLVANQEDCIIVATFQVASTGLNLPKINTVIFGSPSKSAIQVLQSIGRGLRLHAGSNKTEMTLIDIIDDMRYKKKENFAYQHGLERIAIYRKEQFEIKIREFQIES